MWIKGELPKRSGNYKVRYNEKGEEMILLQMEIIGGM